MKLSERTLAMILYIVLQSPIVRKFAGVCTVLDLKINTTSMKLISWRDS